MEIQFKPFAFILMGMSLIGLSIGYILGYYFHDHFQSLFWAYLSAPCLGIGSGLVLYGTLYGRSLK